MRGGFRRVLGCLVVAVAMTTVGIAPARGAATAPRPIRVLVVGDSTGNGIGYGLAQWAASHPGRLVVNRQAVNGCALVDAAAQNMIVPAQWAGVPGDCRNWAGRMAAQRAFRPDVVLFVFGPTQEADLRPVGSAAVTNIDHSNFQWMSIDEAILMRYMFPKAVFLWTSAPLTFFATPYAAENRWLFNSQPRIAAWNSLLLAISKWPLSARIHLAAFIASAPGGWHNATWRPDGVHLVGAGLTATSAWIAGLVIADYRYFSP